MLNIILSFGSEFLNLKSIIEKKTDGVPARIRSSYLWKKNLK